MLRGTLKANGPHMTEIREITYHFRGCIFGENLEGWQLLCETTLTACSLCRVFITLVFRVCRLTNRSGGQHKLNTVKNRYGMGEEQIKETTILGNLWLKEDEEQC